MALVSAVWAQVSVEREGPILLGMTNFHHTAWGGLGAVFDIKQSREGYLWLTTSKGVLRFDGARFQLLEEVTRGAVSEGEIDSVFLSASGGVWLTTEGAGLLLWKDGRVSNFPDRRCTPSRKQGQIIEDLDGSLWVQANAGLFRLRSGVCEQIGGKQGYPGGFPSAILLDREGTLWVKTQTGPLLSWRRGASSFESAPDGEGLSTGFAFLREAPDGTIWLSDSQGLRRVTSRAAAPAASVPGGRPAKTPPFGDFTFAADGSLWAVTEKGIRRFDHSEPWPSAVPRETAPGESFTPDQGLSSDAVWKVLADREGLWIGTDSGLERLRSASLTTVRLPHTQEHEFSIAAGEAGSIWTGNSSLPLTHIAADGRATSVPGTRQTVALWRDHNGTIWSAGAGDSYLWRSSGDRFVPLHYPNEQLDSVRFIATDRHNEPWITMASGRSYHLTGGSWSDQTGALGKKPGVRGAMTDDREGNVWFGFSNKVVRWDGSEYHRFSFPDGQPGVSENTMSVRGDHVWLGGARGVQLFQNGKFYMLRWKDAGVPGRVSGLVETETGDLWINGFSGITHVSAAELKRWLRDPRYAVSAEHLDELDGLPGLSGEVLPTPSLVEAPDGKLWFATTKGLAWLNPAVFEKNRNRVPPPVIISGVISDGHTYSVADGLRLPPRANNLEIDYTALSLDIPERVLFRYKLEGVDEDWQDAGTRRQAFYTKLRPANYRFRVIACNNDGVWNETGATLAFSIDPAFSQTVWFRLLCLVAAGGILLAAVRWRMRLMADRLAVQFQERLAERTRIAQDLHDTLLQGFISALLQLSVANRKLTADSEAKPLVTGVLELMRRVIDEGRSAVQGMRSTQTDSSDLEKSFSRIRAEAITNEAVNFRVLIEGPERAVHALVRDDVYRIGREAIINAFRHAGAANVEVELRYSDRNLRLFVRDDGCGIEPQVLHDGRNGHWGLSGMRESAERIGAKLRLQSRLSEGTEVELTVPAEIAFAASRRPPARRWWRTFPRTSHSNGQFKNNP